MAAGGKIKYGPFEGQTLSNSISWGDTDVASQILGFYEAEVLEEIKRSGDRTLLINLGAADGYYSVGWARTRSNLDKPRNAVAFEIQTRGREVILENAKLNRVDSQIQIMGIATKETLMSLNFKTPMNEVMILSDIEGFEYQILDEEVLNFFAGAKWIIEAHEFNQEMRESLSKVLEMVQGKFNSKVVISGPRNPNQFEDLLGFSDVDRFLLCAEGRDGMPGKWLIIE